MSSSLQTCSLAELQRDKSQTVIIVPKDDCVLVPFPIVLDSSSITIGAQAQGPSWFVAIVSDVAGMLAHVSLDDPNLEKPFAYPSGLVKLEIFFNRNKKLFAMERRSCVMHFLFQSNAANEFSQKISKHRARLDEIQLPLAGTFAFNRNLVETQHLDQLEHSIRIIRTENYNPVIFVEGQDVTPKELGS